MGAIGSSRMVPASAGGSGGGVTRVNSSSLTVTSPTGPTVDIELPASGVVEKITSTDGSLTVTNPNGPTVNLTTPAPTTVFGDLGSTPTTLAVTSTAIFGNASQPAAPTVQPGTYRVDFDTTVNGSTASIGESYSFEVGGGTATYTVRGGPSGNAPGLKGGIPSNAASQNRIPAHLTAYIDVTVAGTVNIQGIASGAGITCSAQDTSFGGPPTTQITTLSLLLIA
jgi:hypothetical protein